MTEVSLLISSLPSEFEEKELINTLISEKLASCISCLPGIVSSYIWKGSLEESKEKILLFKTKTSLVLKLEKRLEELHPYDVPEIISLKANTVNKAYADWILS